MHEIIQKTKHKLLRALPYNDNFDIFINYIKFISNHKRLPRKRLYFNDYLYNIKNSNEILSPLRQFVSDKYLLKHYIKSKIGDKYNVPTIAIFKDYDDLKAFSLPESCCIKPTNASQAVILRRDNEKIDISITKDWFSLNYYHDTRERNYKYLKPMVIVEPLIFGSKNLTDYRIFCYKGRAKLICIDIGKFTEYRRVFYNRAWEKQDFSLQYPLYEGEVDKPNNLIEMLKVAEVLASDFDFVRIDLYSDGSNCMVGEITNCHAGASQRFLPLTSEKKASEIIFGDR